MYIREEEREFKVNSQNREWIESEFAKEIVNSRKSEFIVNLGRK